MTDFEQIILDRVAKLENEVEQLKSEKSLADKALEFERLPASATVGKDYVAYRFRTSEERVMRGEAGTGKIPRVSRRPMKFIKKEVDEVWREYTKTPKEKALEEIEKANNRQKRRRSIITKRVQL